MPNLEEVLGRIKDIISEEIGQKKVYDKDVADILGINKLTLATMKKRQKIPYGQILDFCAKRKISINWLFYNQIIDSLKSETEKFIRVRYFRDIYASAGGGAENYDLQEEFLHVDWQTFSCMNVLDAKSIEAINVIGDSMEPTLDDQNVVFVDKSQTNINKGGIFIVSTPGGLFIKRLQIKSDGTIDLISDNKSYGVENVRIEDVTILGRVVGSISGVG
ncbi:MAG: phage repressor protein [Proteobacteria bacterium]|nr:MAG: phage repressor protein [Pseudomonadota bacterium]